VGIIKELVKQVDVVVENFSPRVMPALGLDYETLKKMNPSLVMVSISNFGQTGPYRDCRATDLTIWGLSGILYELGEPDREPLKMGSNVAEYVAGISLQLILIFNALYNYAFGMSSQQGNTRKVGSPVTATSSGCWVDGGCRSLPSTLPELNIEFSPDI